MTKNQPKPRRLSTRVSLARQGKEGDGLNSQQTRCREYARYKKGYEIAEVFQDNGVSGGLIDRPGMKAMLTWLCQNRRHSPVVLIDDISRLARDLEAHMKLRSAIGSVGARLESPSIEFGEDSDSILVENLLASVSQHQRQKNGEQTKNRMRARMMNGFYVFIAPTGFTYQKAPRGGKILMPTSLQPAFCKKLLKAMPLAVLPRKLMLAASWYRRGCSKRMCMGNFIPKE